MADKNNHTFNTEFAARYSIESALIFGDIYYWCVQNKLNGINLKKGSDGKERFYTFNSVASLQENYKYMNITKIYRVIKELEADGLIITGCFNKRMGDRTRWYAVTELGEKVFKECNSVQTTTLYDTQFSKCNLQNETNNLQNEMTLPNTNTNTNTDTNISSDKPKSEPPKFNLTSSTKKASSHTKKSTSSFSKSDYDECMDIYYQNRIQLGKSHPVENTIYSIQSYQGIIKPYFMDYGVDTVKQAIENSFYNSWAASTTYGLTVIFNRKKFDEYVSGSKGASTFKSNKNVSGVNMTCDRDSYDTTIF